MPQVSVLGGARLNNQGLFEVYLGGGREGPQHPINCVPLKEMIREYYDFLMSDESNRRIGEISVKKTQTKNRKQKVILTLRNRERIILIRSKGQFSTLIYELPFLKAGDTDEMMDEMMGERGSELPLPLEINDG